MKTQDGSYKQPLPSVIWEHLTNNIGKIGTVIYFGIILWVGISMAEWIYSAYINALPNLITVENGTTIIHTNATFVTNATFIPFLPFTLLTGTPLDYLPPVIFTWFFFRTIFRTFASHPRDY